jgi:thiamine transporter
MNNKKLLMMMEIAIFASIGLVLDQISFKIVPNGGSISLVMLPIILIAIRWGLVAGLTTGLLLGIMQAMFGGFVIHWAQGLLDYAVAFTVVGFAGLMKPFVERALKMQKQMRVFLYFVIASTIGGMLRFIAHLLAGVIFFKEYAGDQNPWIYSIIYNCTYIIPSIILTAVVAVLILKASPRLLKLA